MQAKRATTSIIDCNQPMKFTLVKNGSNFTNVYKCFLDRQEMNQELQVTIDFECTDCLWAVFRFQAKSPPNQKQANNIIDCSIYFSDVTDFKFYVNHFPNEWHYISITYNDSLNSMPEGEPLKLCKDILKLGDTEELKVRDLIREKKTGYFSIDYSLSSTVGEAKSYLDIYSGIVEILKLNVLPVVDIGGALTIKLKLNESFNMDDSRKLVVCIAQGKQMMPRETGSCDFNGMSTNATMVFSSSDVGKFEDLVHVPYPDFGDWYVSFGLFCYNELAYDTQARIKANVAKYRLLNIANSLETGQPTGSFERVIGEDNSSCNTIVDVSIFSASCIQGSCGKYGECNVFVFNGYLISQCICLGGYSGELFFTFSGRYQVL